MATALPKVGTHGARARRTGCTSLVIALALAGSAMAQPASSPPADTAKAMSGTGDVVDSGSIDSRDGDAPFEGRVAAYLLSPEAGIAGLIFDDGRQVSVPPHLGARLAALIQPGQQAGVGPRRDDARGPGSRRTITSIASGRTLDDGSPDEQRPAPVAAGGALRPMQASGTIRLRLQGPRGETNGLLLDTGTQVFFPPHVASEFGSWLRPGNAVDVDGYGRVSAFGTVLQATRIVGPGGRAVTVYGPAESRPQRR